MLNRAWRHLNLALLGLLLLAPAAHAGEGLGVAAQYRQEVLEIYQRVVQDPQHQALKARLRGNLNNRAVVDQYLAFLPISPMEMIKAEMHLKRFEFGIPKIIYQYHQRWKQLHPEAAKKYYGAEKASPVELEPTTETSGALEATTEANTVSTNRNMAYNFPIPPTDYQGEIQVAVNPNNPLQIVAAANTWDDQNGTCGDFGMQAVFYSNDGGVTWGYTCSPDDDAYGMDCAAQHGGGTFGSDPALSWNDNNEVFLNYMLLCYNGDFFFSMVVARSADGGVNWNGQGIIKNSWSTTDLEDKNFYLVDTYPTSPNYGRHYTCWDRNNNEKFAYSTNNGVSWTEVDLPSAGSNTLDLGCDIAVQKNGTVHVVFNTLNCGIFSCSNERTFYTRSTNGGQSWSTPVLVVDPNLIGFSNQNCPSAQDDRCIGPFGSIGIDNSGGACDGTIYVTYTDFPSGNVNNSDIWVRRSTNGGSTWSAGVRVNDDGAGGNIQFHPFLAVDQSNGNVVVAWHDARNDPNNRAVDFFVARSTDCGQTFQANVQASQPTLEFNNSTTTSSNMSSQSNANYNPNQYGEYLGLDALGGKAYVAWSDTRHYFPGSTSETQRDNVGFAVVEFIVDNTPPAAPTGLTAAAPVSSVNLDWNDNTESDLAGYNVYRSTTSGGPYSKVNGSLVATSAYTDSTVAGNTTYHYVVRAVDSSNNESADSNQASVTTPNVTITMHVSSIVLSIRNASAGNKFGRATVTIVDSNGSPVSGASVTGTFTGNFTGTQSATTNSSGVAILEAGPKKGSTSFTFCVDNVTHSTLPYNSSANVETCDSI